MDVDVNSQSALFSVYKRLCLGTIQCTLPFSIEQVKTTSKNKMKLVFILFLSCCISASMQQQSSMYDFWSYMPSWSSWRMPYSYNPASYFYGSQQQPHQFVPSGQQVGGWAPHPQQDPASFLPVLDY